MTCKYMNACTTYRVNDLALPPASERYQSEICVTNLSRGCPFHEHLEVRATIDERRVIPDIRTAKEDIFRFS